MPTGIGNRKVLTPRSGKAPRRSLPPQAKLIEAASFDSFDEQPSSPDIMTTKLMEKVKNNKGKEKSTATMTTSKGSFNQRLNDAASLSANSGRSKLSTEEFNAEDGNGVESELSEKYKKSVGSSYGNQDRSYKSNYDTERSYKSNYDNERTDRNYNTTTSSSNVTANTTTTSKPTTSYNASSYSGAVNTTKPNYSSGNYSSYNTSINNNNNNNNSFDRWNNTSFSSMNSGEVEMLQEQISHLRREYDGLKQRFSELSRLRLSEPEELLEEHKKLSESRDQAAEKTIKALQRENELLKKQLSEKNEEKKQEKKENISVSDHDDSSDSEKDFMIEIEKILKIYSSFSGLKITPNPSNPLTQWHCEFSSRSGRFDFQLIYESNLNRYQYVPETNTGNNKNDGKIQNLPQFLASDILITSDQMQIFFWRLLDTLSKKN